MTRLTDEKLRHLRNWATLSKAPTFTLHPETFRALLDMAEAAQQRWQPIETAWTGERRTYVPVSAAELDDLARQVSPDGTFLVAPINLSMFRRALEELKHRRWLAAQTPAAAPQPAAVAPPPAPSVLAEVAAERRRQVEEEGFDAAHDDEHDEGDMALAAAAYAVNTTNDDPLFFSNVTWPLWPWEGAFWWKPTTPRRDLIKAAALIVAEIERLDRAAKAEGQ